MKDEKIQNGIKEIRNIKMNSNEKKRIFEYVLSSPISKESQIKSPWSFHLFIESVYARKLAFYIIVPLFILSTCSGVVFASEESLPDSILYPIKVNIVEPVRGALTFSKESKANYESNLAVKRMIEAETLVSQGKLDVEKEKTINNLLVKHNKKLNEVVDSIDQKESPEKVDRIITNFQSEMNAHAKSLDDMIISKHKNVEKKEKKIKIDNDNQLNTENTDQSEVEQKALNIEIESEDDRENEISKSARWNANEIGENIKNRQEKDKVRNSSGNYKEYKFNKFKKDKNK